MHEIVFDNASVVTYMAINHTYTCYITIYSVLHNALDFCRPHFLMKFQPCTTVYRAISHFPTIITHFRELVNILDPFSDYLIGHPLTLQAAATVV